MQAIPPAPVFPKILQHESLPDYLSQGDITTGLTPDFLEDFDPEPIGLIVISNTCDLLWRAVSFIAIAPIYALDLWVEEAVSERLKRAAGSGNLPTLETLLNDLSQRLFRIAGHEDKVVFFIPPDDVLGGKAAFVSLEQIVSFPVSDYDTFLKGRVATLLSPWREKLGFRIGYLFSRIATPTPDQGRLRDWVAESYREIIEKLLLGAAASS